MIQYRRILELAAEKMSVRAIADATRHGRPKVHEILELAKEEGLTVPLTEEQDDQWIEGFLYPHKTSEGSGYGEIDFEYVHKELGKKGVNLALLHYEYEMKCRNEGKIPYAYRSFTRHYGEFAEKEKATMRIKRKPGDLCEVDWCGAVSHIKDRETGELIRAYVFVATLPCSQLSYAEATLSMDLSAWIGAHQRAFRYFGGVPQIIVPDNLKQSVTRHTLKELVMNPTYQEMCDHYGIISMPARVRAPKDKASVEGSVSTISTWIIAALRHEQCFSIEDLNTKVWRKLEDFNHRNFAKKKGSRFIAFEEEEKFALSPLPTQPYKMAEWKTAKVRPDYHVSVESQYYSIPYEYIGKQVSVRLSEHLVEIFFKNMRVATHTRLYGKFGQLATNLDHMPDKHRQYADQTEENARLWGESVGSNTLAIIDYLLESYQTEKQALSAIFSLKNCGRKYTKYEIECACKEVRNISLRPTVKLIQNQLKANKKQDLMEEIVDDEIDDNGGFTRGTAYWEDK